MRFSPDEVVEALYQAALGRSADPEGLMHFRGRIEGDRGELAEVARAIHNSDEHRRRGLADHSQFGEYRIILGHLVRSGSRHQIVVDVGARGRDRSNSFDLLTDFGWRGLLIEANPSLVPGIQAEFQGTDYLLENCAVGPAAGTLPFYIGCNDDVSSLKRPLAAQWGEVKGTIEVPVERLATLLDKHGIPEDFDLLSLDIEGMDVEVLNDLVDNSAYRPHLVIIEASFEFRTKHLADVGGSAALCDTYSICDATEANLVLVLNGRS